MSEVLIRDTGIAARDGYALAATVFTPAAVDLLCSGFSGTTPERIDIRPGEAGAVRIGHFGFFRPEHRDTLWRDAAEWLSR